MKRLIKFGLYLTASFLFLGSTFAEGETYVCEVEPKSIELAAGDAVKLSIKLNPLEKAGRFEVKHGQLPGGASIRFIAPSSFAQANGTPEIPFIFDTESTAQQGSFNLSFLYTVQKNGNNYDAECQFNPVITKSGVKPFQSGLKNQGSKQKLIVYLDAKLQSGDTAISDTSGSSWSKTPFNISKTLQRGNQSAEVTVLQDMLRSLNFLPASQESTGYFGPMTETAVISFQKSRGIEPIGIVGPKTRKALNEKQ